IGRKGAQFIARTHRSLLADFTVSDRVAFAEVKVVAEFMVKQFLDGAVDTVEILWPRFRNTLVQIPTLLPLLPLTSVRDVVADLQSDAGHTSASRVSASEQQMIFEPNPETVLNALLPLYVNREIH